MSSKGKSARKIYEDAVAQAFKAEEETVAPARWIYEEAVHQAWKVREKAIAQARKAKEEAEGDR